MLDADLAVLYGVSTKALNQAVKRNKARFPQDFMFRLTKKEKLEVVTNCDHLERLKFSRTLPFAFTEHGTIMLANVLNSEKAIEASVQVVRAFAKLRRVLATHVELAKRIDLLERKYDGQFRQVFEAIKRLIISPETSTKRIGFSRERD